MKKPYVQAFENIREETLTFCKEVIKDFWDNIGQKTVAGLRPKLAFFASSIEELNNVLRPAVTQALSEMNIYEYDEKNRVKEINYVYDYKDTQYANVTRFTYPDEFTTIEENIDLNGETERIYSKKRKLCAQKFSRCRP